MIVKTDCETDGSFHSTSLAAPGTRIILGSTSGVGEGGRGAAGGRGGGSVQCPHLVISEPLWPCLAIITRLLAPHNNATGNTVKNISYQRK